jgi:hypothetical protein
MKLKKKLEGPEELPNLRSTYWIMIVHNCKHFLQEHIIQTALPELQNNWRLWKQYEM